MQPLIEITQVDNYLVANYVTSIKKDGTARISSRSGIGGDLFQFDKAKKTHQKTALQLLADLREYDERWCIVRGIYFDKPRCVYVLYSNGEQEGLFQYESTDAPGSGQRTFFFPGVNLTRLHWTACHFEFISILLANNAGPVYESLRPQRSMILEYFREGLEFEEARMAAVICG